MESIGITIVPGMAMPEWVHPEAAPVQAPTEVADQQPSQMPAMDPAAMSAAFAMLSAPSAPGGPVPVPGVPVPAPPAPSGFGAIALPPELADALANVGVGVNAPPAGTGGYPQSEHEPIPWAHPTVSDPRLSTLPPIAPAIPGFYEPVASEPVAASSGQAPVPLAPTVEPDWDLLANLRSGSHAAPAPAAPTPAAPTPSYPTPSYPTLGSDQVQTPMPVADAGAPQRRRGAQPAPVTDQQALAHQYSQMMASGLLPGQPEPSAQVPSDPESAPPPDAIAKQGKSPSKHLKVLIALVVILILAGAAIFAGTQFLGSDEPVAAPATMATITLPDSLGQNVALSGPKVDALIKPVLGFGVRPPGVTTVAAYGPEGGAVELAALATSVPRADATTQFAQFATKTGAEVGTPVVGAGADSAITCASVKAKKPMKSGSMCVWEATTARGITYTFGAKPDKAMKATSQLVAAMGSTQPAT